MPQMVRLVSPALPIMTRMTDLRTATPLDGVRWVESNVVFGYSHGLVLSYVLCALFTIISLRCSCGTGLRIQQRLEWTRHWPIYLRLFGVAILMACTYAFTLTVHSFGRDKHELMTLHIVGVVVALSYALIFLLTEGAFHE